MTRTSPTLVSTVLAAVVGFGTVGCQTESVSQVGDKPREAIAYAATAKYPAAVDNGAATPASSRQASSSDAGSYPQPFAPVDDGSRRDKTSRASVSDATNASSSAYRLAVIDRRGDKQIEILNLTDTAVPASTVWVNGLFVHRIETIPPRGTVKIPYSNLLEAGRPTGDLKQLDQNARKVELQIGDQLHSVDGPAIK